MSAPRRHLPAAALVAALLAVLTAAGVGLFELIALAFSNGQFDDGGWLVVTVPLLVVVWLLAGAVLLLTGRSWLVLFLPAAVISVLLLAGLVNDAWQTSWTVGVLLVPGATAVLTALPGVRRWVAARRRTGLSVLPAEHQPGARRRP